MSARFQRATSGLGLFPRPRTLATTTILHPKPATSKISFSITPIHKAVSVGKKTSDNTTDVSNQPLICINLSNLIRPREKSQYLVRRCMTSTTQAQLLRPAPLLQGAQISTEVPDRVQHDLGTKKCCRSQELAEGSIQNKVICSDTRQRASGPINCQEFSSKTKLKVRDQQFVKCQFLPVGIHDGRRTASPVGFGVIENHYSHEEFDWNIWGPNWGAGELEAERNMRNDAIQFEQKAPPVEFGSRAPVVSRWRNSFRHIPFAPTFTVFPVCRAFSSSSRALRPSGNIETLPNAGNPPSFPSIVNNLEGPQLGIRERLRIWEAENPASKPEDSYVTTWKEIDGVVNALTRPEDTNALVTSVEQDENTISLFTQDELMDFGPDRMALRRGDLVELRSAARMELAIFIRRLDTQSQFYTMSGKWIHQRLAEIKFSVPGFIEPDELDCLTPYLPDGDVPQHQQDKLNTFENALPRNIGASLVTKMVAFWNESDTAYRSNATRLDKAHSIMAYRGRLRDATLEEIASEILPDIITDNKNDGFPWPLLYAIHRSLMQDPLGFRTKPLSSHRAWVQYEISSMSERDAISSVCNVVRNYQEHLITTFREGFRGKPSVLSDTKDFMSFVSRAQRLIDSSRKVRKLTTHGIIGPALKDMNLDAAENSHLLDVFIDSDIKYLRFMESWAALRTFDRETSMHAIGSAILRAIGRYDGMKLDESAAWTCLQEIGRIQPWENRAAFDLRLATPGTILQAEKRALQFPVDRHLKPDVATVRKNWEDLPIYCIDAVDAKEIDDGVSIEPSDTAGECWIHVHVADPTSRIAPRGVIAKGAEIMAQSVYFPERHAGLLPRILVRSQFSLGPYRPCLTVSVKMNSKGQILEQHITRGKTGKKVVYLTPDTLDRVIGAKTACKKTTFSVGHDNRTPRAAHIRRIQGLKGLSNADKENLKSLSKFAEAYQCQTSHRGRISLVQTESSVSAVHSIRETHWWERRESTSFFFPTDPRIDITVRRQDADRATSTAQTASMVVANLMILASEAAAKWCHERGIPAIFKVTERNPDMPDPAKQFRENILPFIQNSENPPQAIVLDYVKNVGSVLPSSSPGPHVLLGIDMYTKFTSPLRRYGDMIAHWQVHAALTEEARLGRSLIGSTRTDYLPFSKEDIDKMIPQLYSKERAITKAERRAKETWTIYALLRAWKFNEALLPPTWEFTVRYVEDNRLRGVIDALGPLGATMHMPNWIRAVDVQIGDVFEVEFEDLNAYTRAVVVKGLRRLD